MWATVNGLFILKIPWTSCNFLFPQTFSIYLRRSISEVKKRGKFPSAGFCFSNRKLPNEFYT